jgi:steroid delta-isomerase-like uncharacterized protein
MTLEENKALVRRCLDRLFNEHDLTVINEVFATDYISHQNYDPNQEDIIRGPEAFKQVVSMFFAAFPDQHTKIEDMVAEGDKVVTRWRARGTHKGYLMGVPPTHKEIEVEGICIDRITDGKIIESWTNFDLMGLFQQLGVFPLHLRAAA